MIEPVFLGGFARGARFALWVAPEAGVQSRGSILCIQPLGDEATLARRTLVAQARRLADAGWTTLIVDLFGTGDSRGETREATLDQWRADLPLASSAPRARAPG
ncbi:MAG: hydrolase 2, exosortase A system-associated, partial [Burkholderiaceae bacterium]|nr:hydrolase 2, exosortase A system-associated [Burkholderiaceae bacterium]